MITIQLTPISYRIPVTAKGQLIGTPLYLHSYLKRFNHTRWDNRSHQSVLMRRYVHYDDKSAMLFLPRYDFDAFCQMLRDNSIVYTTEDLPLQRGEDVEIRLKPHVKPRDQRQADAIEYLVSSTDPHRGLSAQPGFGKTVCTGICFSRLSKRTIVCVAGLVDQWKRSIFEFTELTEDDVYIIQGAVSLDKLLQQIDKTIFPKIILASLGTLRAYATGDDAYEDYPPFTELFDRLRVGIKVIDEAHLNFYLTLMIDLQTNAAINIALTATFDRGDPQVKRIFDSYYPHLMRFGEDIIDRYVDVYSYSYSLGGGISSRAYLTPNGYNHSKLEEYLIRRTPRFLKRIYEKVYLPIIFGYYVNRRRFPGEKLLILFSTKVMCEWMQAKLTEDLPTQENFNICVYTYKTDDSVLTDADIIISTLGSAGTGRDLKNLITVLMTIATGSDTTNRQTLGRLRKLSGDVTPVYVYTWNSDIPQHNVYQSGRRTTYMSRGKSYQEITV